MNPNAQIPSCHPCPPVATPWRRTVWRVLVVVWALAGCGTAGDSPSDRARGDRAAQALDVSAVAPRVAAPHLDAHWHHGAFMEIFVRAYQDSNGDGVGDLRGLISRLDYLRDLGIRGLWLMPVMPSADRDHGYATTDYRGIEPDYGNMADFDELLRQAHARGIGVVVDYVINHSAAEHPMFQQALQGPENRFYDWFVWSHTPPQGWDIWGKNPWYHAASRPWSHRGPIQTLPAAPPGARGFYFGTFGPHMPDFNLRHPQALAYHEDSLRFWLNRGLDGFRLDAVPHMIENSAQNWNDQPESRQLTRRLKELVHAYPHRYLVCEATAQPQDWGDPQVCGGAFAFGYVHHFVQAALGKSDSVQALASYYQKARPTMATFVSNHDIFAGQRLWDQVQGDEARYKLAAAGYLLQPGTPFIYYGEEVGQAGIPHLSGDFPLRGPMSWTHEPERAGFTTGRPFRPVAPNLKRYNAKEQAADPRSLLSFYKAVLKIRNTRASVARGQFENAFAQDLVLGFERVLGQERTLVLINYGTQPARVDLSSRQARAQRVFSSDDTAASAQQRAQPLSVLILPAQSVQVWDMRAQ